MANGDDKTKDPYAQYEVKEGADPYAQYAENPSAQPTQFEQDRTPQGSSVGRFLTGALGAGLKMIPNFAAPDPGQAIEGGVQTAIDDQARKADNRSLPYRLVAGLGQAGGFADPTKQEEMASHGDMAGIIGNAAPSLGMSLMGLKGVRDLPEAGGEAIENARGRVGDFAHNPRTGTPKSVPRLMSDTLINTLFPESEGRVAGRQYEQRAQDLMRREQQQNSLDARAARLGSGLSLDPNGSEEGISGSIAKPSGRLVKSEQEFKAGDRMYEIAKQKAHERGMQFAGGQVPSEGRKVPRSPTPTETFEYPGPREGTARPFERATTETLPSGTRVTTGSAENQSTIRSGEKYLVDSGRLVQGDIGRLRNTAMNLWERAGRPGVFEDFYADVLRKQGAREK